MKIAFATFVLLVTLCTLIGFTLSQDDDSWGGLYPRESVSREVRSLDGIWNFRLAPRLKPNLGFEEKWYKNSLKLRGPVLKMPVPSSYNDITMSKEVRDHIGWVWYDRKFMIPGRWIEEKQRIVLRVGSAHYNSIIYVNGKQVASHEGGHLPINVEITANVVHTKENLLTICLNNTLTPDTIPQGKIIHQSDLSRYPPGYFVQTLNFDFFNYAGLHRPVYLYTTPATYIEDIEVKTTMKGTTGYIYYRVEAKSSSYSSLSNDGCSIKVYDKEGKHIRSAIGCTGSIAIERAHFWWPYLMADDPGYLYTLMVTLSDAEGNLDVYPQKVGIRELGWNSTTVTINGKPLYLMGCGKHEDANIRGKGVDYPTIIKDFNLLKWLGANSFRTSHYPYAEEIMDVADEEGIMVINESPAVGLSGFGKDLMERHISVMKELVRRDKNRPSVIMWSVGNEPQSTQKKAKEYFQNVTDFTRSVDSTRPVTCVLNANMLNDLAAFSLDVVLVNRYFSWYGDVGHLEVIERQTVSEYTEWHLLHGKPVMISEYGAGSLAGVHIEPSFAWSEEYQVDLLQENFKAFDELRRKGFFFGEHIWNFADFATEQETFRPPGCMKGIFTRDRQPKMAARIIKNRFWAAANDISGLTLTANKNSSQENQCI